MADRPAGFAWTDEDGVDWTYDLARPLLAVAPRRRRREWRFESLRGDVYVERAAAEVTDVEGTIRFGKIPQRLLHALSTRVGRTVTYFEVRGGMRVDYEATLVSVSPGDGDERVAIEGDPDRHGYGEFSARVRLRFTDPADAAALFTPYP